MNTRDECLTILAEECAEVIVECSKIQRFDNDGTALAKELGDLFCMVNIAIEQGLIDNDIIQEQIPKKRDKLQIWSNLFGPHTS